MPEPHPSRRSARAGLLVFALLPLLSSCLNHHLIHPTEVPLKTVTWRQTEDRGPLRIHLEWAAPEGEGPFPAVLVHPEAGKTQKKMRGVIWDLATRGYLAVAADYERREGGRYRRGLFPWRAPEDVTAAYRAVVKDPRVDRSRMATLGFSKGGVFSLLIASEVPDLSAVVAYYPVTDFEAWLYQEQPDPIRRFVFKLIRRYFRKQLGNPEEAEFREILRRASPYHEAGTIRAPVLLIHGAKDRSAPVAESVRLAERLEDMGREVELLVIPEAGHVFNFKSDGRATQAWEATLAWLSRHLGGTERRSAGE